MPTPPDRAADDRWYDEPALTGLLTPIEAAARATLRALRCPTDPGKVFAILNGERPAPWPKRTAARDRQRARNAMSVLTLLPQIRTYLRSGGAKNSLPAVYYALVVGLHANDAAVNARRAEASRRGARKGGKKTGAQRRQAAIGRDAEIRRLAAHWRASYELQLEYRFVTQYVGKVTGIPDRTIRSHFVRLRLARSA